VRLLDKGPVTIELQLTNTVTGPTEFVNVIGELPGKDKPAEWVLVGAHLDSWDFATGAADNGAGSVQVIQAARALATVAPLRRTIRFALWGGEEQFMIGSRAYALAHAKELDNCIAALNSDGAAGHVLGWWADGRPDVQRALAPIAKQLLTSLGGAKVETTFEPGSDQVSFLAEGVPSMNLAFDEAILREVIHRPSDTVERIDPHVLASGVAVIAVTAFAIADSTERLAPRQDRKTVEAVFKSHGYDAVMRAEGWWK
jgi:Zn-dependent M28 family amino/carboxypeptidase